MSRGRLIGVAIALIGAALVVIVLMDWGPTSRRAPRASSTVFAETAAEPAPASAAPRQAASDDPIKAAPAPPEEPSNEEAFLRQLEQLNRADKPRALELALRGEDRYSDTGVYAEARKAMIITLLVDLGRISEARTRVREFIRKYPDSRYRHLVQGVTGVHPRPGAPDR